MDEHRIGGVGVGGWCGCLLLSCCGWFSMEFVLSFSQIKFFSFFSFFFSLLNRNGHWTLHK